MADPIIETLHREISETQKRRHKLDILKIAFVTALLGFGAVKIKDITTFYQVLYLAPLVAVFFDLLVMGQHFFIRRIGAFLRLHSESALENKYQKFVRDNRDRFFKSGSRGFTLLSYIAALALLQNSKGEIEFYEFGWFSLIFIVFIVSLVYGNLRLKKLDELTLENKNVG